MNNTSFMSCYYNVNFEGLREGVQQVLGKLLMVAGAGLEPHSMHKQNCFQLPQAAMALPDYNYIIVRSDVANTSGPVNDARH